MAIQMRCNDGSKSLQSSQGFGMTYMGHVSIERMSGLVLRLVLMIGNIVIFIMYET